MTLPRSTTGSDPITSRDGLSTIIRDAKRPAGLLEVSSTLQNLFRTLRSLFRFFEAPSDLFEASSNFSKSIQNIPPDSPGHSATSPAPPRGGTTGHRAGQGGGKPRLRKSSARQLYHLPVTRTVLLEFTFLGPTGPTEGVKISERGATAPCEVPEPGKPPMYKD
jgi:hypothetical protein